MSQHELCLDCTWEKLTKCARSEHVYSGNCVVYLDSRNSKIVKIRVPWHGDRMHGKTYKFWHTIELCKRENKDYCQFPHDPVEEVLWNAWKDKYCSTDKKFLQPGLKEPSSVSYVYYTGCIYNRPGLKYKEGHLEAAPLELSIVSTYLTRF